MFHPNALNVPNPFVLHLNNKVNRILEVIKNQNPDIMTFSEA